MVRPVSWPDPRLATWRFWLTQMGGDDRIQPCVEVSFVLDWIVNRYSRQVEELEAAECPGIGRD